MLKNIILVNNNYEKMDAKKQAILEGNAKALKNNKIIGKKKRASSALALVFSILFSGVFGLAIWFSITTPVYVFSLLTTKLALIALETIFVFVIIEGASIIRRRSLEKGRQIILGINEAILFTTFIKDKKLDDFSVNKINKTPGETQHVYVSFFLSNEEKSFEYASTEKWTVVIVPTLFNIVIDAENTTIYLPEDNPEYNEVLKLRLENQINQELLAEAKTERDSAEKKVELITSERNAIEKALMKSNASVVELQKQVNNDENTKIIDALKKEKESTSLLLAKANATIAQQTETVAKAKEAEDRVISEKEILQKEIDNLNQQLINEKEQQQARMEEFKARVSAAVKEAKDNMEKLHEEEKNSIRAESERQIESLKSINKKLAEENNSEALSDELRETKLALDREVSVRTLRDRQIEMNKEQIKVLEEKIKEFDTVKKTLEEEFEKEKRELIEEAEKQKSLAEKASSAEKATMLSYGMQERTLVAERDIAIKEKQELKRQLEALSSVQNENVKMKEEISSLKNEDAEKVKAEYEEKLAFIKEEKNKMEKKMRDALESAAREKANRIRLENEIKKQQSERKRAEKELQQAQHDAEIEKAREAAAKARNDAVNSKNEEDATKRPQRRLNF